MKYFTRLLLCLVLTGLLIFIVDTRQSVAQKSIPNQLSWAGNSVIIDGRLEASWAKTTKVAIPFGNVFIQNNADYLYLAFNIFSDDQNDPDDTLTLFFDLNHDHEVTSGLDLLYGASADQAQGYSYISPTSTRPNNLTFEMAQGFRDSVLDGFRSPKHKVAHRVWEFRIPLVQLRASPNSTISWGFSLRSGSPFIDYGTNFDFSKLTTLRLGSGLQLRQPIPTGLEFPEILVEFTLKVSQPTIRSLEERLGLEPISVQKGLYRYRIIVPERIAYLDELLLHVSEILETLQSDLSILKAEVAIGSRLVLADIPSSADWVEVTSLLSNSEEYRSAKPVAHLEIEKRSTCTGFLVSLDVLMTANHCLPARVTPQSIVAIFNLERGVKETYWDKYFCDELLLKFAKQDAALLRCRNGASVGFQPNQPGEKWGLVTLCNSPTVPNQSIYVVHHSNLLSSSHVSKKLSFGLVARNEGNDFIFDHDADTLRGASGAPIFASGTHQVIGIHLGGVSPSVLDHLAGARGINQGVSLQGLHRMLEDNGWWERLSHC